MKFGPHIRIIDKDEEQRKVPKEKMREKVEEARDKMKNRERYPKRKVEEARDKMCVDGYLHLFSLTVTNKARKQKPKKYGRKILKPRSFHFDFQMMNDMQ